MELKIELVKEVGGNKKVRVRFAPSPTGHLHIGSARTALFNWLFARANQGIFILRIEDTDVTRSTKEYEASIIEELKWLGLDWDEGADKDGSFGPYRQSQRLEIYQEQIEQLLNSGSAYYCYCTADELEAERQKAISEGKMPKYSGKCRSLSNKEQLLLKKQGKSPAVRFAVSSNQPYEVKFSDLIKGEISISTEVIGDFILLRADGSPTYNFAAAVDDFKMKITHVLRGEDHITNTVRQILVCRSLNQSQPQYGHFPMILGADGGKLSKRHSHTSISEYRDLGFLPEAVINYLSLLSWSSESGKEVFGLEELRQLFSLNRVGKSAAIFNFNKLEWLNKVWIKKLPDREIARRLNLLINEQDFQNKIPTRDVFAWLLRAVKAIKSNITVLLDAKEQLEQIIEPPVYSSDVKQKLKSWKARESVKIFRYWLNNYSDNEIFSSVSIMQEGELDLDNCKDLLKKAARQAKDKGIAGKDFYHSLRFALTGKDSGLELFYLVNLYGKERCLNLTEQVLKLV